MLFPAVASRVQPSTALPSADRPLPAFSEEEATVFMMLEPSSPVESIHSPQRDAQKRLNEALTQREATQVGKPYLSADMFLSEQVGNPQKAKEHAQNFSLFQAALTIFGVWGVLQACESLFQNATNQFNYKRLCAEGHAHSAMASLAQESEKGSLLGEITHALKEPQLPQQARQLLEAIQAKPEATVTELHQALAALKHFQAKEALSSVSEKAPKWLFPALGLAVGIAELFSSNRHGLDMEQYQTHINQRNRAILNQAGRDLTLQQAKENFPEYFSPLNKPSAN
jgi:hypothetical protein